MLLISAIDSRLNFSDKTLPWARYYDSGIGRFLEVDPDAGIKNKPLTSINKYVLALNTPTMYTDPTGKFFFVPILVGAIIGGLANAYFNRNNGCSVGENLLRGFAVGAIATGIGMTGAGIGVWAGGGAGTFGGMAGGFFGGAAGGVAASWFSQRQLNPNSKISTIGLIIGGLLGGIGGMAAGSIKNAGPSSTVFDSTQNAKGSLPYGETEGGGLL